MQSNKATGRVVGVLFLTIFILGITIYQILQGPILFEEDYYNSILAFENNLITSIILGIFSGVLSIIISILVFHLLQNFNKFLGYLYLSFCIVNFIGIILDSVSVASMIEYGKSLQVLDSNSADTIALVGHLLLKKHWWTHYLSLLISCFPLFIFYYTMTITKLIPRVISLFGLVAVVLMFLEMVLSLFDARLGMNMLLPLGLAQITLPIWLIIKGFNDNQSLHSL